MKRSEIKKRPLSDTVLASLEPDTTEYRELDSPGLYFRVKPQGGKSWQVRYKNAAGKWTFTGIGSYPGLSGQSARKKAADLLDGISRGIYPSDTKDSRTAQQEASKASVSALVAEYIETKRAHWTEGTLRRNRGSIQKHVIPVFGHRPFAEVRPVEWMNLLQRLQQEEGIIEQANRIRGLMRDAYDLAKVTGRIDHNPLEGLNRFLQTHQKENMAHVSPEEVPELLRAIRTYPTRHVVIGLELMALLFCRPSELRQAPWAEFDLEAATWTIPAARMKKRRDYMIPLPRQAVALLRELQHYSGYHPLLFPGRNDQKKSASNGMFNMALRRLGYGGRQTGHGFRHIASTHLNSMGFDERHVEAALSHITTGVKGVYNKAVYFEQRRAMLQEWADHLDTLRDPQVIQFTRPASA